MTDALARYAASFAAMLDTLLSPRGLVKGQEHAGLRTFGAPYAQDRAERDGTEPRGSRLDQGGGYPRVKSSVPDCTPEQRGVYGEWCRDPNLCAGKGFCPRDPTCGD